MAALQQLLMALKAMFRMLDTVPSVLEKPDAIDVGRTKGRIEFEEVSFSYATRKDTLRSISFTVEAGQALALVGPTGAGKSTLVSLLPRHLEPSQGRITIDGIDVRDMTLESLRAQFSIVLQEPLLFSGTIKENIAYGRIGASDDEIEQAARDANAHDFICRLPEGYDTPLGERGAKVSGGERQRIAVARAFLRDAPVLILDEPTSSIDSRTEAVILEALERLMQGRTTIMIAHRLSTIRSVDKVLVLHEGRLVDSGTHDELLEHEGLYRELWEAQTRQRRRTEAARDAIAVTSSS
jgi:ABC-type multidrug transport system fused ATPase/permease subunit